MNRIASVLALLIFPLALCAQWPDYPSPNVPKDANGKPDLNAPPPRTSDGHIDFSGIWENVRGYIGRPPRGFPANPVLDTPPPPPPPGPPPATFFNIGAGFPGGQLPLMPWAAKVLKERMDNNSKDNPDAHCLPMGLMQLHEHPQPRKIIQTPNLIVMIYEANSGLRQIFMDGRTVPSTDAQPWWYGYSVGHWEGDTLVVQTSGFRDDVWLDINGSPLTNKGRMIEKFRRPTYGHLDIDVTIDDPSAYTKPYTVSVHQQIMLNTELIEFICGENEKSDAHLVGK